MATTMNGVDTSAILREGQFFILDDYALRDEMYAKVEHTFLEGIESIEGRSCRDKVAAAGLSQMHEHFPVEKVPLLEDFLLRRLRKDLYPVYAGTYNGLWLLSRPEFHPQALSPRTAHPPIRGVALVLVRTLIL